MIQCNSMHPSEGIYCAKSKALDGKKIVLGITGSIAAIQSFELARELMRHGAKVYPVMSQDATKFITATALHFATGNEVVVDIDGRTQHVSYMGEYEGHADLLLISPCTSNTISKIATGICDTSVTTMAAVAMGTEVPVIIVPAMNLAMYENPAVQRNVEFLKSVGVSFVGPEIAGKKARNADSQEIVEAVIATLGDHKLSGKRVLVIGGATQEKIDDVRLISNISSGESALELAIAARRQGADVELWHAAMSASIPNFLNVTKFTSVSDLLRLISDEKQYDLVLVPAALSDYGLAKLDGKLSSDLTDVSLKLIKLPKVLPLLRKSAKFLVGFKAECVGGEELIERAKCRLDEYALDLIVANNIYDVTDGHTKSVLIQKDGQKVFFEGTKKELANVILDNAVEHLQ